MKIYKYRAFGGSFLILFLLLSLTLSGCADDTFNINKNDSLADGNFKIRINAGSATSTFLSSDDDVVGTEDENYINIDGEDYKIYIFGKSGKYHDEIQLNYSSSDSNPSEGSYCFTCNLPLDDEDLEEVQVVCFANTRKWVEFDTEAVTDINDLGTGELVFNYQRNIVQIGDKNYSWQPNKVAHDGIPMAGVSEKKAMIGLPDATNQVDIRLVRALSKIEIQNSDLYNNGNSRMYVKKTGCNWVEVYLYAWNTENWPTDEILGGWPGSAPTGVMTINEAEYYYWDLGENKGKTQNFIFNNNNKGIQMDGPQNVVLNRDFYVEIVNDDNWTVSKEFVHDGYTVFINKQHIDLEDVYLYVWGDNEILGSWPGRTPTGIRRIEDSAGERYYYFWDLGTEYEGQQVKFIFSGGTAATKLPDIEETFTVRNGHNKFFTLDFQGGGVKVEKSTITVTKPQGWEHLYVYEYNKSSNEKIFGEWPGTEMTEKVNKTIDGIDKVFYQIEVEGKLEDGRSKVGLDAFLLFNDGHGQQLSDHHYNTKDNLLLNLSEGYFKVDKIDNNAEHHGHRVYVKDPGWDELYVYNWGDVGEIFFGWPGKKLEKVNKDEKEYYYVDFYPGNIKKGSTFNLIFNNNKGIQTEGNYNLRDENFLEISEKEGKYYVRPEGEHEKIKGINEEGINYYKVFVNNTGSTWGDNINLYMWGDVTHLGGEWPGMQSVGKEEIEIEDENKNKVTKEYHVFNFEPSWNGLNENIILNNPPVQMADYNFTINGDLYISMLENTTDLSSDHTITPDEITIYVKNNINWADVYLYTYGETGNTFGDRPGQKGVATGTGEYGDYKFTIKNNFGKSAHLVFNNGNGLQLADYEVKLNGDLYLSIGNEDKKLEEIQVEFEVEEPDSPDNINSIGLLEYNTTGLLLPRDVITGSASWWNDDNEYTETQLPTGVQTNRETNSEGMHNLYFVQTKVPGQWVCYVPEWNYNPDTYTDKSLITGLNLLFNIKNYKGVGTSQETQDKYPGKYVQDGDSYIISVPIKEKGSSIALQELLRNHLYQGKADINTNFEIIYTICPWDEQTSGDIEFE